MRGPVASFLRVLFRRRRFEDGLSEELRFHVDAYAADLMKNGVPPEEAARQARAAFGGMEAAREECRQAKGARTLDRLRQDLMYSVRLMRRAPAFTAAAIVAIGLGIGVNTAIFSLIDGVLLRKLPIFRRGARRGSIRFRRSEQSNLVHRA